MNEYTIYKKKDGKNWKADGFLYADSQDEANKEFARQIWAEHADCKYGDNTNYIAETQKEYFDGPGYYDFNHNPPELVFSDNQRQEGVFLFHHDTYSWTVDAEWAGK